MIRVLVACEKSRRVAAAFEKMGFDAWSCDILPAEVPGNHIQDNVLKHLDDGWDLMIAHPPCTYLSRAGLRWLFSDRDRMSLVKQAAKFFNTLLQAPIPHIAIENPMQHRFARQYIPKYDQTIEPFMFGDREHKRTCLWIKRLPLLNPSVALWNPEPVRFIDKRGGKHYSCDMYSPSQKRQSNRSRTFQGIANAMADQWGKYLLAAATRRG